MALIKVTQEDIQLGQRQSPFFCAAALAIKRAYPKAKVILFGWKVLINRRTYFLPPEASERISQLDETGTGQPFEFELSSAQER